MRARYDSTSPRDVTRPDAIARLQVEDRQLVDLEELDHRRRLWLGGARRWRISARSDDATAESPPRRAVLVNACADFSGIWPFSALLHASGILCVSALAFRPVHHNENSQRSLHRLRHRRRGRCRLLDDVAR